MVVTVDKKYVKDWYILPLYADNIFTGPEQRKKLMEKPVIQI